MTTKTLETKLEALAENPDADLFILADAKDADMGFGLASPGPGSGPEGFRSIPQWRGLIREIVRRELVDIMLMSASTSYELTIRERIFDNSPVTPAVRVNDSSDIHLPRGGAYRTHPARPFRTATLDHIQCGEVDGSDRTRGASLGLYSVTFNNNLEGDLQTLGEYRKFRIEAERRSFDHFLEVFDPNISGAVDLDLLPQYVNDMIARTLAGVCGKGRPRFLKMAYHGPRAVEALHHYDPSLIIGILGGSAGTSLDAFQLLCSAKKYGARVALFGRKINHAEDQFSFISHLRTVADGLETPEQAVRAYHGDLEKLGIEPTRSLSDDLQLQTLAPSDV